MNNFISGISANLYGKNCGLLSSDANSEPLPNNYKSLHNQPVFKGAKARKMLEALKNTKNVSKLKFTFDEMVDMYYELGYSTLLQRGSHALVDISGKHIPLVMPHGSDKTVSPFDIKRLKLIANGDIEKALNV